MESLVVDASIVVKWYIVEKYSEEALKLRDMHVNGELLLVAPSLLPYEVLNALKHSSLYSMDELKLAAESLLKYGIRLEPLTTRYAEKSVELAVENGITIYDASYIAVALIKGIRMVTADSGLIEKLSPKVRESILHISEV